MRHIECINNTESSTAAALSLPLNKSPARMQAANMRPKKPFRQQLEDAVSLKFGGGERFVYYGTPLEDSQLQDGPQ